jgi:NADH:ubiquinone oxidoreductase subunit E
MALIGNFSKEVRLLFTKLAIQAGCSGIDAKRNTNRLTRVPDVLLEIQHIELFVSLALTRALASVVHFQLAYVKNVISFCRDTRFCRSHQ